MTDKKAGAKKSPKKGKAKAKTKKSGGSHGPTLTTAGASGALLFGPEATPSLFTGVTYYQSTAVFLQTPASYLLVMYRPQGNYSPADVGAAASYFSQILGKPQGAPANVLGYTAALFGQSCLLMVSAN